jgi:2-iminobutanoate/2-iminopropanoate deaminase
MKKEVVSTAEAPAAVGPYSQAICAGGLLFLSGQIPLDPATGNMVQGAAQVVKPTVFITDMKEFGAVNEVYKQYFTAPCPARSCVQVAALPLGAQVEIEAVAVL